MHNKPKVLSLFSGVGSFEKALAYATDYEIVAFSEIDTRAIKAYSTIHKIDESLNLGDIKNIVPQTIPDFDIMTYGFPCTDISIAGKQEGLSGKESGLLWDAMHIAKHKRPPLMIAENVKNLVGKRFYRDFQNWLFHLKSLGYYNSWAILNVSDYGLPQNRERVFIISSLEQKYGFPQPTGTSKVLRDIMETGVDQKYSIDPDKVLPMIKEKDPCAFVQGG